MGRLPENCISVADALNRLGTRRFGDAWRPYCPVCLNRAEPDGDGKLGHFPYRHLVALSMAPPLIVLGWLALFDTGGITDDRYLTSRISFFLLAVISALLSALYGGSGIARRKGWFHSHPPPSDPVIRIWMETVKDLQIRLQKGLIRAQALTIDGELYVIDPAALPDGTIQRCIDERSPEKSWRSLLRHLRLKNAPTGRLVLNRADVEQVLETSETGSV